MKRPTAAFTLVEILISLAILGTVIALASSVFFVGQQSWVKQRNSMGIIQNGQYALEQFLYDVRGASIDNASLLSGVDGVKFQTSNEANGTYRFYWRGNGSCGGDDTGIYRAYSSGLGNFCVNGDLLVGSIVDNSNGKPVFNVSSAIAATQAPSPRVNATMVAATHNNQLFVFGGQNSTNYLNDLYIYDMNAGTWSPLTAGGSLPSVRANFAAAYDDTGPSAQKMYVFGGHDSANVLGETYMYNLTANTWSKLVPAISAPDWYDFGYQHRLAITVNHTKVGAALTNFPVYVNLDDISAGHGFWSKVRSDGGDILVTDSSGNRLAVEVVSINVGGTSGEMYFNASALSNTVDTVFYLYYDNSSAAQPAATAAYGRNAVWANSYAGVWHLQEAPANGVAGHIDSTGNGHNGTPQGFNGTATSTTNATGTIGKADYFDGSNDYVNIPDSAGLNITNAVTISTFFNPDTVAAGSYARIAAKSFTSNGSPYTMYGMLFDGNKHLRMEISHSGTQYGANATSVIPQGAWSYGTVTFNGTALNVYFNGTSQGTSSYTGTISTSNMPLSLGRSGYGADYFDGRIDETRLSNVARSSAWISTEYNNLISSSSFYSIGSEVQAAPLGRWGMSAGFDNNNSATRNMYIFGGATDLAGANRSNNVYYYDALANKWNQVNLSSGIALSARVGSAGYYIATGTNKGFFIYGGYDGANYLSDQKSVSSAGAWSNFASSTNLAYHTMAYEKQGGSYAYVFGGINAGAYISQLKQYQINGGGSDTWTNLAPSGTAPTARAYHMAAFDDSGSPRCMYVYGGYDGTSYLNDFYVYDPSVGADGQWTQLSQSSVGDSGGLLSCNFTMRPHPNAQAAPGNSNYTFSGQARGRNHGTK